jgi:myo-inositol-hexaphosphate 3-phosphohydrolase
MLRPLALASCALFAVACSTSVEHIAMPATAADAPKEWSPLLDCAKQRGLRTLDMSAKDKQVVVYVSTNDQLDITYKVSGDHIEMQLSIWGETTDEDRPKILATMKKTGMEVWDCAQAKVSGAPAAAPSSSSSTP